MGGMVFEIAGGPSDPSSPLGKRCGYQKAFLKEGLMTDNA